MRNESIWWAQGHCCSATIPIALYLFYLVKAVHRIITQMHFLTLKCEKRMKPVQSGRNQKRVFIAKCWAFAGFRWTKRKSDLRVVFVSSGGQIGLVRPSHVCRVRPDFCFTHRRQKSVWISLVSLKIGLKAQKQKMWKLNVYWKAKQTTPYLKNGCIILKLLRIFYEKCKIYYVNEKAQCCFGSFPQEKWSPNLDTFPTVYNTST